MSICLCGKTVSKYNKYHLQSKQHLKYLESLKESKIETESIESIENEFIEYESDDDKDIDEDFLDDLNVDKFNEEQSEKIRLIEKEKENVIILKQQQKEEILKMKQEEKLRKIIEKEEKKKLKNKVEDTDDEIFSDKPTEIIGLEKRQLLNQVKQYKILFKKELKDFKIKKNPNINELKEAINEIDIIINGGTIDNFITDSILQCIKLMEIYSSKTKNYDISGLSLMLKNNQEFNSLCKQLYIKYGVFNKIEPEYKLLMIISVSAMICRNKNLNKDKINDILDQEFNMNE